MKPYEKKILLRILRLTRTHMHKAAMAMHYYANGDGDILEHAKQMQGAVDIMDTWIEGIKNDK
jgi:hypothetical protein